MTPSGNGKRWVAEPHLRSHHTERGACAPERTWGHVYTNVTTQESIGLFCTCSDRRMW
jgi:hypothetical protein